MLSNINFLLSLGFLLAFSFGFIAHRSDFCTMGAIADIFNMEDYSRLRMWFLAIAIAILGTQLLHSFQYIDIYKTIYLSSHKIFYISHIIGGLCFGIGMVLASGCGNKTLIRFGSGNLKSLIVLLTVAISSYATLKGVFAPIRVNLLQSVEISSENVLNLNPTLGYILSIGLILYVFKDQLFRRNVKSILSSIFIGLLIPAGFYLTGHLGYLENPNTLEIEAILTNSRTPESFSFIAPIAYSLELIMLWTDESLRITFGILSVFGVILGSFISSQFNKTFYIEYFNRQDDFLNHLLGGVLMGFGGVCALGCTIGQGLTGIATLSIGSFLSLISIILGSWIMLKIQYTRLMNE